MAVREPNFKAQGNAFGCTFHKVVENKQLEEHIWSIYVNLGGGGKQQCKFGYDGLSSDLNNSDF